MNGSGCAHDELAPLIQRVEVEEEDVRVQNPYIRIPPGRSTANDSRQTGASSGQNTLDTGLNTTSKLASGNALRSRMSAKHRADVQFLPLGGHLLVAAELPGRVVEDGHAGTRRRQHRPLLAAAEARHRTACPVRSAGNQSRGHRLVPDQHRPTSHRPAPGR